MEPDFQTVAIRVVAIGLAIAITGFTLLFIVFRSFAEKRDGPSSPRFGLMIALAAFVLICCAVLFAWSYVR